MRDIIRRSIMSVGRLEAVGGCASSGPLGSGTEQRDECGPITVIVPFPPGGVDLVANKMLPEFSRVLGVPVKLVNRPGNSGTTGTTEASRAAPDGRTLLFAPQGPMAYQPAITPLAYDPERSFVSICRVSVGPSVLMASERSGFRSARDVVAAAKTSPGKVTYSSPGVGSLPHVVMATLCQLTGVQMRHATAAGAAAAVAALKNGTAEVLAENVPVAIANSGQGMHIIGVFGPDRLRELPEVPTLAEQGFDVSFNEWTGLFAPAGTPPATVSRLEGACKAALCNADVVSGMVTEFKSPPAFLPSSEMLSFLSSEVAIAREHVRKSGLAQGNLLVSANDAKMTNVGELKLIQNPGPDTLTLIDVEFTPPRIRATVNVPVTIIGPPLSVALTPDERLALVTSGSKVDPADATKLAPDNRLSVVDLLADPPQVVQTLELGSGPQGVSINRTGSLALVANYNSGTVSVLGISGKNVKPLAEVAVGTKASGLSHVAIAPNGRHALVTREGDHMISVLRIQGEKVEYTKRDMTAGVRPYGVMISPDSNFAVVANIGRPQGDSSTVSLIDMRAEPFRVVDTVSVGSIPEGLAISPDGRLVAAGLVDGSTKPEGNPFKTQGGRLILLRVDGMNLSRISEVAIGSWVQGVVFARDSRRIYVQNGTDREIQIVHVDQDRLVDKGERIRIGTVGAALRASY